MTFQEYVHKYLNKINPANSMAWYWDDMLVQGDVTADEARAYLEFAQAENLRAVMNTGRPLDDVGYIEAWERTHPKPVDQRALVSDIAEVVKRHLG